MREDGQSPYIWKKKKKQSLASCCPGKILMYRIGKIVFQQTVSKGWALEGRGSLNWRHIIVIGAYKTFDLHMWQEEWSQLIREAEEEAGLRNLILLPPLRLFQLFFLFCCFPAVFLLFIASLSHFGCKKKPTHLFMNFKETNQDKPRTDFLFAGSFTCLKGKNNIEMRWVPPALSRNKLCFACIHELGV